MIDVIIPAYNAHNTIYDTLYSISYQSISDLLNVYIVNDASVKDYSEIVDFFSNFINVKELKLDKNSGPGVARQYGIDNSNSEYIVFIDSDDVFSSTFSLSTLYKKIKNDNLDIVISNVTEETTRGFYEKGNNTIWLHGKMYRRSFLEKNNIRFNLSRQNEDNGFNQQAILLGAKTDYIDTKTYIWRCNLKSLTRINNYSYRYDSIFDYIYNVNYALEIAIKKGVNSGEISDLAFMAMVFIYYIYLEFYEKDNINNLLMDSKKIYNILKKYKISETRKIELLEIQYESYYDDDTKSFLLNPIITFNDFLSLVDEVDS